MTFYSQLSWNRLAETIDRSGDNEAAEERNARIGELRAMWGENGINAIEKELRENLYTQLVTSCSLSTLPQLACQRRGSRANSTLCRGPCTVCHVLDAQVAWTGVQSSRLPEPVCLSCNRSLKDEWTNNNNRPPSQ